MSDSPTDSRSFLERVLDPYNVMGVTPTSPKVVEYLNNPPTVHAPPNHQRSESHISINIEDELTEIPLNEPKEVSKVEEGSDPNSSYVDVAMELIAPAGLAAMLTTQQRSGEDQFRENSLRKQRSGERPRNRPNV